MPSQGSGAVSKASGVCSPHQIPRQAFYQNSGINSPAQFGANYEAVIRGLPYKPVSTHGFHILMMFLKLF